MAPTVKVGVISEETNRLMAPTAKVGVISEEAGTNQYKLLHIKQTSSKNSPYDTGTISIPCNNL